MKRDTRKEMRWIVGLIVLAIASRLFPHPPNFAPITGIALFSAAKLHNKWTAFLIPLVGLFLPILFWGSDGSIFLSTCPLGSYLYGDNDNKKCTYLFLLDLLCCFSYSLIWVFGFCIIQQHGKDWQRPLPWPFPFTPIRCSEISFIQLYCFLATHLSKNAT